MKKPEDFHNIYVLSREDMILSKVGRYSEKDIEDISVLMEEAAKLADLMTSTHYFE